jgi:hypothetical protein
MFAYFASLCLLDARVLFSNQRVSDVLGPGGQGNRRAIERHHLFPKGHLKSILPRLRLWASGRLPGPVCDLADMSDLVQDVLLQSFPSKGEGIEQSSEKERYANRETAQIFPIVLTTSSLLINPLPWQRSYLPHIPVTTVLAVVGGMQLVIALRQRFAREHRARVVWLIASD